MSVPDCDPGWQRGVVISELTGLATALLDGADDDQRAKLLAEVDDPQFREWTYLPGERPGLPLADLDEGQTALVHDLLRAAHSPDKAGTADQVVLVERVRRQLALGQTDVGPDKYWLRLHGRPGKDEPWGWRINGHHLAVHLVVVDGRLTVTPHFFGTEPAEVREGPHTGLRPLAGEEDTARELLHALDDDQRGAAVVAPTPPDDILTRYDPVADPDVLPTGLARGDMTATQQAHLDRLVQLHLRRAPTAYAEQCWLEAEEAGLDRISFAWAGGTERGERHYFCVRAPEFFIEYDNTQDDGNHAHSVWRHLRDDWGGDPLRQHYAEGHRG